MSDEREGFLLIWRRATTGIFIGRGVRITVLEYDHDSARLAIELPLELAITVPGDGDASAHALAQIARDERYVPPGSYNGIVTLARDVDAVFIGRGIEVRYFGDAHPTKPGRATIGIRAPRKDAVTRDDFTLEEHLEWQRRREAAGT